MYRVALLVTRIDSCNHRMYLSADNVALLVDQFVIGFMEHVSSEPLAFMQVCA